MGILAELGATAAIGAVSAYAGIQRLAYRDAMHMLTDLSDGIEPIKLYHNARGLQGTERNTFDGFLVKYLYPVAFVIHPGRELAYRKFCRRHGLSVKEATTSDFSQRYWESKRQKGLTAGH